MKAVILNSGIGSRMGKFTEGNPKCLTLLDGTTLLGHQLTILSSLGIGEFIITTGPFAEKIEEYVKKHFPNLSVTYVHNPKYSETNYIYSLYLARENLDDDIILMHGDIVCDPIILKRVMMHDGNGVLINRESELPKKDFKGRLENDRVTEIGIHIFDENCYELMPVYKLSRAAARAWLEEIENFVEANNVEVYAEEAFNKINSEIGLGPISYTEFCMEIDTPQDLEEAKNRFR